MTRIVGGRAKKRGIRLVVPLVTAAALLLSGCAAGNDGGGDSELTGTPIKIGLLADLTGPNAVVGIRDSQWGLWYQDTTNAAGGINGHPIQVVTYDTKSDPATAASGARRLIESDGVVAISCCISSSESLQASAVGKELGVPVLGGAIVGQLTDENDPSYGGYFRVLPGEEDTAQFNVNFAKEQGWKTAYVTHSSLTYGTSGLATITRLADKAGIKIIGDVPLAPTTTEASAQAAVIEQANPDGVLMWDYPAPTAVMANALRQAGYEGDIATNWSGLNDSLWAIAGADIKDFYAHDVYDPTNPRAKEAVAAFTERFGVNVWSVHQMMQSSFMVVIGAAIQAVADEVGEDGEVTGEAVRDALLATDCLPVTIGPEDSCITFGNDYVSAGGANPYEGANIDFIVMKTANGGVFDIVK